MQKDRFLGNMLLVVSAVIVLFNAAALTDLVSAPFIYGFLFLAVAVFFAIFLLKRDSIPQDGMVFVIAAMVNSAALLWGGALGPAAFLYPLLFLWLKHDSVSGPVLTVAGVLGAVEFIAPVVSATGIKTGGFDLGALMRELPGTLVAGIIPLVSMAAVEYMGGEKNSDKPFPEGADSGKEDKELQFPDDVARSLIPILKAATGAHGIFLFVRDPRETWALSEFVADTEGVSVRYMVGPDDPVIRILNENTGDVVHVKADSLSVGGSRGLPWYIQQKEYPWVTLVQFRRNGVLNGFMVLDYDSDKKRKNSSSTLVDSVFLLGISWELAREENNNGFLTMCEEMESTRDVRSAVHRLTGRIVTSFPETTATVAIVNRKDTLAIFESRGPLSDGRAGREFHINDGVAGLAVSRRAPVRRWRMGEIRTFGEKDDPHRIVGSCCTIPLEDQGVLLGVLAVESSGEQHFSPDDLAVFKAYATVFSLAVSRNQLQKVILQLRDVDRLTGLPLLSSFYDSLTDLIRGVRSRALTVSVLAVDINGFSKINKEMSYAVGDAVLRKTADRIKGVLGEKAVLARYGSDSFLICLAEVDRVSAEAYAARIHEEFAHEPLRISGRDIFVRMCIGGAVSHVDRMILKLPDIAIAAVDGISSRPGFSIITDVGQFYETK